MSWPTDGLPRFKVTTPYTYVPDINGLRTTRCEVLDRAYCHHIAAVCEMPVYTHGGSATVAAKARRVAARLEAEYATPMPVTRQRLAEHLRELLAAASELCDTVEGEWGEAPERDVIEQARELLAAYDAEHAQP